MTDVKMADRHRTRSFRTLCAFVTQLEVTQTQK